MLLRVAILISACIVASQVDAWSYGEQWTTGSCKGKRQSPINIVTSAVQFKGNLKVETFNFDTAPMTMSLSNNGHTAVVSLTQTAVSNKQAYTMFEGKRFEPLQFHYHWGKDYNTGSEHTIDNHQWPMELHVVHKNAAYNASEFLKHGDGALVLGFMIGKGATNVASKKLTDQFGSIVSKGATANIANVPKLGELLPPNPAAEVYYYEGSLTTPECNEAVQWIVSNKELTMDENQFAAFRALQYADGATTKLISGNYRPVQAMEGRQVQRNFVPTTGASDGHPTFSRAMMVLTFIALVTQHWL